jgi:superfamily II DNA or RNA helicase
MKITSLKKGDVVSGIIPGQNVTLVGVESIGPEVVEIVYKDSLGNTASQLLYKSHEDRLHLVGDTLPFSFNGDGTDFRLAAEAFRISVAHLFDPLLAVSTSLIIPLPHQISAVYEHMLQRQPLRYLLADDPGAGKTIMAGLLIKELMFRGDLNRCMIIAPGNLTEQWQDELYEKFGTRFELVDRHTLEKSPSGNPFLDMNRIICRLDHLSRNEEIQDKIKPTDWDLIIVDEAHKMSASYFGNELKMTKRFQLGRMLSGITRNLLLMTATPHRGKDEDFQIFLSLIDGDRFEGRYKENVHIVDTSDIMRRLIKEDLLKFDGTKLFPERKAYSPKYDLSKGEAELYTLVTEYVREEMNRAERFVQTDGRRRNQVGFALVVLQRRLASSPEAIYQSLKRRKKKLEERLSEEELLKRGQELSWKAPANLKAFDDEYLDDLDDLPDDELLDQEEELVSTVSAAQTIKELKLEIKTLVSLVKKAEAVRNSGVDKKWDELLKLLESDELKKNGKLHKLIIFTEHKDTLYYLTDRLRSFYGSDSSVLNIYGGMHRDERKKNQDKFKNDKNACILVATDAASEGINLQFTNLMINYDLPWNPNRIEQRFGRIHRIGQEKVCHLWNLVAHETKEGAVFQRLFEKLETARKTLGGKVFDVLGSAFTDKPLKDLLKDAIQYTEDPQRKIEFETVVDHALDVDHLNDLLEANALSQEVFDQGRVTEIKEEMEKIEARKLQPNFVESFFIAAFKKIGGSVHLREKRRYEIIRVPAPILRRDRQIGDLTPVQPKYHRICFDKRFIKLEDSPDAEFVTPGHPLMYAITDLIKEKYLSLLKQGTTLINEEDLSTDPKVLFFIEHSIKDGVVLPNGSGRIVSKQIMFSEINKEYNVEKVGYAPYLDYRAASESEIQSIINVFEEDWIKTDLEQKIIRFAAEKIVPEHLDQVTKRRIHFVKKAREQVKDRLTKEIHYWDHRGNELKAKEEAGKHVRMNSGRAFARAEKLAQRLEHRMAELDLEAHLTPTVPFIIGGALVIPKGMLFSAEGKETSVDQQKRKEIELAAMKKVMEIERKLGRIPKDVSAQRGIGYDIQSAFPEGGRYLFIEVKGKGADQDTVTVHKSEIMAGLNQPDNFRLAVVRVTDGIAEEPVYIKEPFDSEPGFAQISSIYSLSELLKIGSTPS